MNVDNDSLSWQTTGEEGIHKFLIEKRKNDNWLIVQTADGKGESSNFYSLNITPDIGENQYRIKYIDGTGKTFYSGVATFTDNDEPVTFSPQDVSDKITLSRVAQYKVFDPNGNLLTSGKDKEISLNDLSPGLYYLVINNRTEQFVKK